MPLGELPGRGTSSLGGQPSRSNGPLSGHDGQVMASGESTHPVLASGDNSSLREAFDELIAPTAARPREGWVEGES